MTLERLDELHDQAVLEHDQVQPRYAHHEDHIRSHVNSAQAVMENLIREFGYDTILQLHYTDGASHPHDYNVPLDLWDQTPD